MAPPAYHPGQGWLTDFTERCLDPRFSAAIANDTDAAVELLVSQPHPGVLEFPLFSEEYVLAVLREVHSFEHWCKHRGALPTRPNSMNSNGVIIRELGLDDAVDELLDTWLLPLTRRFFASHAGSTLDHQHSFVVDYADGGDTSLDFHVDDSEVTLNACLGLDFAGAEVFFQGVRCSDHRTTAARKPEFWQWDPVPGRAILHAGAHRHGVRALQRGRRMNLIVWARSTRHRRENSRPHQGPVDWCCECMAA